MLNGNRQLSKAAELGHSIWLDYFHRSMIDPETGTGKLAQYINQGLQGVTSNPAIFSKAIHESDVYDDDIRKLAREGLSPQEIFESLAVEDIQAGADVLHPVYERTEGRDGYISLEVNPHLARRTVDTIQEARRLAEAVDRPNLMIKVPATSEGIPAVQTLTAEGYNINITLIFSRAQYELVAEAYLNALERRVSGNNPPGSVASVASFFVSRIDVKVDQLLDRLNKPEADYLKGKTGIATAKLIYQAFRIMVKSDRMQTLRQRGARIQRVLFGSTSTKNPRYPDTLYPDNLIGPDTVNTLPIDTLEAFMDHGTVDPTLEKDFDLAMAHLEKLAETGIDLDQVTARLLEEGIQKFIEPYDLMIAGIEEKAAEPVQC